MIMKKILLSLSLGLLLPSLHAAEALPNILFIMSDDHTTQAIGAYGSRLAKLNPTPNIDASPITECGLIVSSVTTPYVRPVVRASLPVSTLKRMACSTSTEIFLQKDNFSPPR